MNEDRVVTFALDPKADGDPEDGFKLVFDFNCICDAEEKTRLNLMDVFIGRGSNSAQTRALLFGCLKKQHPLVTLNEAGDLLSRDMTTVLGALAQIVSLTRAGEAQAQITEE